MEKAFVNIFMGKFVNDESLKVGLMRHGDLL